MNNNKKINYHTKTRSAQRAEPRPSTAPVLGVCEWSPEGLHDKSLSLIPNTDEILKLVKKKINESDSTLSKPRPIAVERLCQTQTLKCKSVWLGSIIGADILCVW